MKVNVSVNVSFYLLSICIIVLLVSFLPVFGGGPLILFQPGTPFRYDTSSPVVYNLDLGDLGNLTNEQADFLAVGSFAGWEAVPTASITFIQGSDLAEDVTLDNADMFLGNPGVGDGLSPVVYDSVGNIISDFFGAPPGVLGIAGPTTGIAGTEIITESFSIFNGVAINPADLSNTPPGAVFQGVFTHEHGHFINLAHTVVNGQVIFFRDSFLPDGTNLFSNGLGLEHTETMYPFISVSPITTGEFQAIPDPDDAAILSTIYPDPSFFNSTGTITGTVFDIDGITGLTGVQVIARNVSDLAADAVSAISGDFSQGAGPLGLSDGSFTINGLTPGANYLLYIIDTIGGGFSTPVFVPLGGTAGPSLGPLPGPEEFFNGTNESTDPAVDEPGEFTTIAVSAGNPVTADIIINGGAAAPQPADALIWLPFNTAEISKRPLQQALLANGKSVSLTSDLTLATLSDFSYLFVILGMFPENHVIEDSSAEAMMIEAFLASGGKAYMEGGDVWFWDPKFNGGHDFGPSFGIKGIADGSADLSSIVGGPCLTGMNFTYSGDNNHVDRIDSTNNSFVLHSNASPFYNAGIGFDFNDGAYRTIGTSFMFGGLSDFSISFFSKDDLMAAYLDFFDNGCDVAPPLCEPPLITPTSAEGTTGDEITIAINIEENPQNIDAFGFNFVFDPGVLSFNSVEAGDLTAGFDVIDASEVSPGEIRIGAFGTSPVLANSVGSIADLNFTVTCDGCADSLTSLLGIADLIDDVQGLNLCTANFTFEVTQFNIGGMVIYCPTDGPVADTDLILSEGATDTVVTDVDGNYFFENVNGNLDYTLTPSKTDDIGPLSITCFDAALAARIAVGLDTADFCDSLAADVDEDGNILTFDAALICRFAVGLPLFGANDKTGEWRFIPMSRSFQPLDSEQLNQDFVASLLGDVDGNWTPASTISSLVKFGGQHVAFVGEPQWSVDKKKITTNLSFDGGISALSLDLDLIYDPKALKFLEVHCLIDDWQFQENNLEAGRLRLGMFATEPLSEATEFVQIIWEVMETDAPTTLRLERALVNQAAQGATELQLNVQIAIPTKFALHQNYPNPFNPETTIEYELPKAEFVTLKIYNVFGQVVKILYKGEQEAGFHKVNWNGKDFRGQSISSGVYFYRIEAGKFSQTRKLAVLR